MLLIFFRYPAEVHLVHVNENYFNEFGVSPFQTSRNPDGFAILGIFIEGGGEDLDTTWFDVSTESIKGMLLTYFYFRLLQLIQSIHFQK